MEIIKLEDFQMDLVKYSQENRRYGVNICTKDGCFINYTGIMTSVNFYTHNITIEGAFSNTARIPIDSETVIQASKDDNEARLSKLFYIFNHKSELRTYIAIEQEGF